MNKSITRRVLAIFTTVVGIGVLAYLSIAEKNEIALGALISGVSTITGYYFGVSNKS